MTATTSTMLEAALSCAMRGWSVFPCWPGAKEPLTANGCNDATTDEQTIRGWWQRSPAANIAVACGPSGLVVVDKDTKNGVDGRESWRDLRAEHGIDDDTISQTTPSGGEHLLYRANGTSVRNSTSKIAPGIDVRAEGGYILVPPSRTKEGDYVWQYGYGPDEHDLMPLPGRLAKLLTENKSNGHEKTLRAVGGVIRKGEQHSTLVSLAGTMRNRGMTADEIEAALLVTNEKRLEDPAPPAHIATIARSVERLYDPAPRFFALTDLGNAERFTSAFGEQFPIRGSMELAVV